MLEELNVKADDLRGLHQPGRPLVLPNAWDAASARMVVGAGFPVVATSSGAIAASLGHPDDDTMPVDDAFEAIRRIASAVDVPVSADIEAGYGLAPSDLVGRLLGVGAVGCNLEDTDHHGGNELIVIEEQVNRIAAIRAEADATGLSLVLNARIDLFRSASSPSPKVLADGITRAQRYREAGADCVFPIGLADESAIERFVQAIDGPVNILLREPAPSISRLAELGVARISIGGGVFMRAYAAADRFLKQLRSELDS